MRPLKLEEYMMNQLKHKVAVVTGVSRLDGIGAAICKELAEAGYDIFLRIGQSMIKRCLGALIKVNKYNYKKSY